MLQILFFFKSGDISSILAVSSKKCKKWWNDKINDLNMMSQDIGEFIYLEKMLGSPKMITLARM